MLRIAILIAALVAGAAAAWMALALRGEPAVATTVMPPTPVVLVASADLGLGEKLTKENMRWQSWPESALTPAYIKRSARPDALEALAGSIVRSRMMSGDPIRNENLVPLNAGFLSTMLPSGKRAVAVPISAQTTAGGFILPNDRVDVILTVAQGQSEPVSRTILSNVPVLAIDQTVDERSKDENAKAKASAVVGKTATLELDPSQVEILTASERAGTLSLALRSAADNGELTRPQNSQAGKSLKLSLWKFGRIEVVDITAPERSVELAASKNPLGPAEVPGQVMRSEPQ
jgi:pilus assembly protein CpaB